VEGEVMEIADFGAFIRIGPVDALLHVSQLMDDFISYDEKQGVLTGKETKRKLASGDQIRTRITAVSLGKAGSSGKIGVTARQPFLGKLQWIDREVQTIKEPTKDEQTKEETQKERGIK
jgi:DNA-directed RNA polymerase subunit E'